MRTITELIKIYGKVYVVLPNKAIQYRFFSDAEREGFTFSNGEKPTSGECYHLIGVHSDKTLTYVSGWASNVYYNLNRKKLITVDYDKYIGCYNDYLVKFE